MLPIAAEGVFDRAEQELVENIFRLDDRKVAAVMTPRKDIVSIDMEDTLADNRQLLQASSYSRFPVCKGGMEHVLGILDTKRMLDRVLSGQSVDFIADLEKRTARRASRAARGRPVKAEETASN